MRIERCIYQNRYSFFCMCLLALFVHVPTLEAQQVYNDRKGEYLHNSHVSYMYLMDASNREGDYLHSNHDYNLKIDRGFVASATDRFNNINGAAYILRTGPDIITVPPKVLDEVIDNNKGFTISFWVRVNNFTKETDVFNIKDKSGTEKIALRVSKEGYFYLLKYSTYANKMIRIGQARYSVTANDIKPSIYEYGLGYIFVSITSDKYATRLYYSRPGGKLYANYFWFGLTDVLTKSSTLNFGLSTLSHQVPESLDDLMIYKEPLTPELSVNHFLLQSPLYPRQSYIVKDQENKYPLFPKGRNYGDGFIITGAIDGDSGIYDSSRWFIPSTEISQESGRGYKARFFNAKTMNLISRYNAQSGNYYYQYNSLNADDKSLFYLNRIPKRPETLLGRFESQYEFSVYEYVSKNYYLGLNDNYMYLDYPNNLSNQWRITGSFNSSVREDFASKANNRITVMNYGSKKFLGIQTFTVPPSDEPRLIETDVATALNLNFEKISPVNDDKSSKYGFSDYKMTVDLQSAKFKITTWDFTGPNIYVTKIGDPTNWQLVYVKDDPNGKPLYLIRTNSGYGARIMISNGGSNSIYINQNEIDDRDNYPDNYLWSINVK